ncbi:unnamed protein product [Alopecurus aequalis]
MGKFVLLAVLSAALVAVSVAQDVSEQSFRDAQCQHEVQAKPLHDCRLILQHQLTGGGREGGVSVPLFESEWSTRERCCQQLQSVSLRCRCSAIRGMVRDYEQTMPPLGGGRHGSQGEQQEQGHCGGETAEHHQQGGGYYGEEGRGQQQGQVLHREKPQQQQEEGQQQQKYGEGFYGETSRHQQGQQSYREGAQQVGRVRLMKMRQYVARLPTSCQIEPMECSVFSADQY